MARADSYEMGIPAVPLGQLYSTGAWRRLGNVRMHFRAPVERIDAAGFVVAGERCAADYYVCALPFERLEAVGCRRPSWSIRPSPGCTCGSTAK